MYWLDPLSYTIQGVISSQLSMDQTLITLPTGGQVRHPGAYAGLSAWDASIPVGMGVWQ